MAMCGLNVFVSFRLAWVCFALASCLVFVSASLQAQDDPVLIDVTTLDRLDAIRYDLNGDGRVDAHANLMDSMAYEAAFGLPRKGSVICIGGCTGYELMNDLDFNDTDAIMPGDQPSAWSQDCVTGCVTGTRADGTTGNTGWEPICYLLDQGTPSTDDDVVSAFVARFDGNDHTISNLYINIRNPARAYAGLFGVIDGATLEHLGLVDVELRVETSSTLSYVGGLVGYVDGSSIADCYATVDIDNNNTSTNGRVHTGGVAGSMFNSSITSCYASGSVVGAASFYSEAGGIVGGGGTRIVLCYAAVEVTSESGEESYAGGIVGSGNGVSLCYATGNVEGKSTGASSFSFAGGLVGQANDGITACYATGNVTRTGSVGTSYIGGLVGSVYLDDGISIAACYATGFVSSTGDVSDFSYAGGLVGATAGGGAVVACYATGGVESSSGSGGGTSYAGGLVGGGDGAIIDSYYASEAVITNNGVVGANALGAAHPIGALVAAGTYDFDHDNDVSTAVLYPMDSWNVDIGDVDDDGDPSTLGTIDGGGDDPWSFGDLSDWPVLSALDANGDGGLDVADRVVQQRSLPTVVSFATSGSIAEDKLVSGTSLPQEVVLNVSGGGFASETEVTIRVDVTTGVVDGDDYMLMLSSSSGGALTGAHPLYMVTIPAGGRSIILEFKADDVDDDDEVLTLTLSSVVASEVGTQNVHTIMVREADDHGDTRDGATVITAGTPTDGHLFAGDNDYFTFTLGSREHVSVYAEGTTDTYGYLEDNTGGVLDDDDDNGLPSNFLITQELEAGTYYVRVRGYDATTSGNYRLHLVIGNVAPIFPGASFAIRSFVNRVGDAGAVDLDGDIVSYTMVSQTQTTGGSGAVDKFEISSDGTITVKAGATLAEHDAYELGVTASDNDGASTTAILTVEVRGAVPLSRLIDVDNADKLAAIRYDLDGDGVADNPSDESAYMAAFGALSPPAEGWGGYKLTSDIDFSGTIWGADCPSGGCLERDGTEDGASATVGWDMIGDYGGFFGGNAFIATFDGNGYTIRGLYINRPSTSGVGLFGYVVGSLTELRNVQLEDVSVSGRGPVGGLVGTNEGSAIRNSYVTGAVSGELGTYVGGLVGRGIDGFISSSYSTSSVYGKGNYVGGLVGEGLNNTIIGSYATGNVRSDGGQVGGLVGWSHDSMVTHCYATGEVEGSTSVGGLIGRNVHVVVACYATGDVISDGDNVGGLVGYNEGSVTACYAIGNVDGKIGSVGGLVGHNEGSVTACYAIGKVRGLGNYAGGLVGRSGSGAMISASYAVGDVSGASPSDRVGGLVGSGDDITDSYYTSESTISNTNSGGTVNTKGSAETASALQAPTSYGGAIYPAATWNAEIDDGLLIGIQDGRTVGDDGVDDPWNFGTSAQYPVLRVDFDRDGVVEGDEFGPQHEVRFAPSSHSFTVFADASSGTEVGVVRARLAHTNRTLSYSILSQTLNGADVTAFSIANTDERGVNVGTISVSGTVSSVIGDRYTLEAQVDDGAGGTATTEVIIEVTTPRYTMSNGEVTACSGTFLDSRGDEDYSNDEEITMTIAPEVATAKIRVDFTSFTTELGNDLLRVYDGATTSVTEIGSYSGTSTPGAVFSTSSDGKLTFRFTSNGSVTHSGWEASINCVTPTLSALAAPSGLATGTTTETSIELTWDTYTGATGFSIFYSTSPTFDPTMSQGTEFTQTLNGAATGVVVTGLRTGTTYYFRVAAVDGGAIGVYAAEVMAMTEQAGMPTLVAPSGLDVRAITETSVALVWDTYTGATGFSIFYSTSPTFDPTMSQGTEFTQTLNGNATGVVVTGLGTGTIYYFRVAAVDGGAIGVYASEVMAMTEQAGMPTLVAPSGLDVRAITETSVALVWDTYTVATGFSIFYSTSPTFDPTMSQGTEFTQTLNGNATGVVVTGLGAATTYYFRVAAVVGGTIGAYAAEVTAMTAQAGMPTLVAPSGLDVRAITETSVALVWDTYTVATGFSVFYSTSAGFDPTMSQGTEFTQTLNGNATGVLVTGLEAGTTYYFRVAAVVGGTIGAYAAEVTATTAQATPTLTAPSGLDVEAITETSVALSWDAYTGATGFSVFYSTSAGFDPTMSQGTEFAQTLDGNATGVLVTGLEAGTTYYFRVAAVDGGTIGAYAAEVMAMTVQTTPTLTAPSGLAVGAITETSVALSWDAYTVATGFRIFYSTSAGFDPTMSQGTEFTQTLDGNATGVVVTGLEAGMTYYFRVAAVIGGTIGAYATEVTATTAQAMPTLPAPSGLDVGAITETSVALVWDTYTGATGFSIFYSTSPTFDPTMSQGTEFTQTLDGDATGVVVTGLEAGTTYYFRVAAVSASTIGAYATEVTAMTEDASLLFAVPETLSRVVVYPNPTSEKVLVSLPLDELYLLSIFTLDGRLALRTRLRGGSTQVLDVAELRNGVYLLEITSSSGDRGQYRILKAE